MASLPAGIADTHATRQGKDDLIAAIILRLSSENEILTEEVLQLRAAIRVYMEWAARLSQRQNRSTGESYGTL
jgi:hypothetical protein